jgi:class 3 adenylate cyclase
VTSSFDHLSLAELIRLRDGISQLLWQKFGRNLALVFTDVEGSTAYFARFGDEAGRALQQSHIEIFQFCATKVGGRIVDTAGDGAFSVFPAVDAACAALKEMQAGIALRNSSRPPEHVLKVRCGVHWGHVLTDGQTVTGDSVNFCSRVAGTGQGGEIRLSREAFGQLSTAERPHCTVLPAVTLKGFSEPVPLMLLAWQDQSLFPTAVTVDESGERILIPSRDTVTFGRLRDEARSNDVVLSLPDPDATLKISRWHFELRRSTQGFVLKALSSALTEVDGVPIEKGAEARVRVGSVVRVAGVLTLHFRTDSAELSSSPTVYGR